MPRPREYTPARRRAMQMVMCAILAVTIVLAAVISRSASRALHIDLAPQAMSADGISVHLPNKWHVRSSSGDDPRVVAQAIETETNRAAARTIQILVDRVDTPISPAQYLQQELAVAPASALDSAVPEDAAPTTIEIAGYPGVCLTQRRMVVDPKHADEEGAYVPHKDVFAAAILPSMQAVVIHLSGDGLLDPTDEALVQQVAASMKVANPATFDATDALITLLQGIELAPPPQFDAVVQTDPNHTDRLLWRQLNSTKIASAAKFDRNWTSIEVVGCLFPQLDQNDPATIDRATSAIQTLLLVRDGSWRNATITAFEGAWKAESTNDDSATPPRAYLLPDSSGRALLAIFHGGPESSLDSVWKSLISRTKFLPSSDVAQLEDSGSAEAARIRKTNLNTLIPEHDDQWWLWTNQSARPHFGWSNLRWQAGKFTADVDMRARGAASEIVRINGQWNIRPDTRNYSTHLTYTESLGDRSVSQKETATLDRNELTLTFLPPNNAPISEHKLPAPSQFVPGELLPLIVGQLSPGPLLLRSESFIDCPFVGAPETLAITFRPGPATNRKADGDDQPMRVVTAEVNGAGRVSHWYFRNNGDLESIELPDNERHQPSDPNTISFDFGKDGQMSP